MTTLSVVLPTMGRDSLQRACTSVTSQMEPGDELIVLGDHGLAVESHPQQRHIYCVAHDWPTLYYKFDLGYSRAACDYIMFLNDDDWLLEGSLARVRSEANADVAPHFHLFGLNWRGTYEPPRLVMGHCNPQQAVVPNVPERPRMWRDNSAASDWLWIAECSRLWPTKFHDFPIAEGPQSLWWQGVIPWQ